MAQGEIARIQILEGLSPAKVEACAVQVAQRILFPRQDTSQTDRQTHIHITLSYAVPYHAMPCARKNS